MSRTLTHSPLLILLTARRPAQRIHIQCLLLSQWSVQSYIDIALHSWLHFNNPVCLSLFCISIVREDPHFHSQQIWVSVCEKAGQDEPVPGCSEDPQRCPFCSLCQPPRQRRDARDRTWGKAKHSFLDLLGQDGRASGQCFHAGHPFLGWVPQFLDQLERRRGAGKKRKGS